MPTATALTNYELAQLALAAARLPAPELDIFEYRRLQDDLVKVSVETSNEARIKNINWALLLNFRPPAHLNQSYRASQKLAILKTLLSQLQSEAKTGELRFILNPEDAKTILNWLTN